MYFFSALLFALSANIDSFIIGLSCGIGKTKITYMQAILISLITFCCTLISLSAGRYLLTLFSFSFAEYAGKAILAVLGLYYILKFLHHRSDKLNITPLRPSPAHQTMSWKAALLIGTSLSVNNLGIGLGASISGLSPIPSAIVSFIVSVLFLLSGNRAGHSPFFQKSNRYSDLSCGLLLILLSFFC